MAEAAAAFRFQDSNLVAARERALAARFEAGAVVVAAAVVAAIGRERCDQFRARHRRILRLPHCRVPHRSGDLCAGKNPPSAA